MNTLCPVAGGVMVVVIRNKVVVIRNKDYLFRRN